MVAIRSVLVLLLLLAGLIGGSVATAADDAEPAPTRTYHIYMLLWRGESDVERGFRAYVEQHKLPFRFTVRNANQDIAMARTYVAEAKALKPDLVYTWGTPATLAAAGEYDNVDPSKNITDIPIVFTMVSFPVAAKIVPDEYLSGRNVTGTTQTVPTASEIEAIRSYRPFDKLAIIYNPAEVNSIIKLSEFTRIAKERNFTVVARAIPLDANGKPQSDSLPGIVKEIVQERPQFLYLGPDTYVAKHANEITELADENRLPSFAGVELVLCNSHALFGFFANYFNLGQLTALKAAQILLEGKKPQEIAIESTNNFTYVINQRVMSQLKLYPPMRVLEYARVVRSCSELRQ